ncbi:MAG: BON domain-containing protein, partial [bacterium]
IANDLMDALERKASVNPDPIEVRVEQGDVYLEGATATQHQREQVFNIARMTPGVTRVIDNMIVKPSLGGYQVST